LLVFFVLMLAISDINKEKFESVINAISASMGGKQIIIYKEVSAKDKILDKISDEQLKLLKLKPTLRLLSYIFSFSLPPYYS